MSLMFPDKCYQIEWWPLPAPIQALEGGREGVWGETWEPPWLEKDAGGREARREVNVDGEIRGVVTQAMCS